MLQWVPLSDSKIIWNNREEDRFISRIFDISTGKTDTFGRAIYHLSPDGRYAVCLDFARIQSVRPGYGYAGVRDDTEDALRPESSGVWLLDLTTGQERFLFSIADIAGIEYEDEESEDDKHWFNHAAWNTDGSRFLFLNRWRSNRGRFPDFRTRMFTSDINGKDIRLVTDKPYVSHFVWIDSETISIWQKDGYKEFKDDGSGREKVILPATNGHQTYLPGNKWMLGDTYIDSEGYQNLFLYHIPTGHLRTLKRFSAYGYQTGELRCDLHPRLSRDCKTVFVDSTCGNDGRQLYAVSIDGFTDI